MLLDENALHAMMREELASALNLTSEQLLLDQSFLAQGGDSLSAIQLMARCRAQGIEADIVDILKFDTLSELLSELVTRTSTSSLTSVPSPTESELSVSGRSVTEISTLFAQLEATAPPSVGHVQSIGPCSLMQNRIIIGQAVHPAAYHCSFILTARTRDHSPLSTNDVAKHWLSVVQRHPSLRTTFIESTERPGTFDQIVWDQVQPSVTILQDEKQIDQAQAVNNNTAEIGHHMYLAEMTPNKVMLRLNISHAIVDGRSAGIVLRDLCDAFSGEMTPGQTLRHADFAIAEDQLVDRTTEDFWRAYLQGAEETYLAGNNVTNKAKTGLHSLQRKLHISPEKTRKFCHDYGITVVNVCQVAWGMVLRTFALKDDISYSYITSGRQTKLPGMSEAVGLFISSLVLRMDFASNIKVLDLLKNANEDVLRQMPHDRGLRKRSSKWGNSILSFQRAWQTEASEKDSLRFEVLRRLSPTDYDHSLNVEIGDDTIIVDYDIWKSTTDVDYANNILSAYLRAIEFVLGNPNAEFGEGDLLGREDSKLLQQINGIPPTPNSTCIHTIVAEVTSRQPDAVAVFAWDGTMTFRQLDRAASALANHLSNLGVGPEVMVGMSMDKSRFSSVSTLAILKAGGVVLPLSTQQPLARLQIVLNDTQAKIILVDAEQKKRLSSEELPGLHLVEITTGFLESLPSVPDGQVICPQVGTSNAAWVVYTSGSTGVPKGVVLQHSALCSSIEAHGTSFGVTSNSRVLQFASHTFDVMIQETFTTLCKGGCVCIPSEQDRLNNLEQAIISMEVNFLSLTSTVAGLLNPAHLPAIKTVILMGEPVKPAVLDLWMHHADCYESYAPSECSIYATCSPQPMKNLKEAPVLGAPLSSCFWVVDPKNYNHLLPFGAPGELLIEGPLLARGYLNDIEKTNKSFIIDPDFVKRLGLGSGRRMYRTGDLVKRNNNGTYSTLGRRDMQINIRGQRVEIGEVEYHITQRAPGVQAVIVLLKHHFDNEKLVAAFSLGEDAATYDSLTVEEGGDAIDKQAAMLVASDLQQYLAQHVPDYMIPRTWVPLAKLPVNTSGKADRRAVSTWIHGLSDEEIALFSDFEQTQTEEDVQATTTEQNIRQIWSKVLNVPVSRIKFRRSFLSYGGDSITAMQVVSACRQLGISLSVRQVLQSGGISVLALEAGMASPTNSAHIPDEPFDLSPAQLMYFNEIGGLRSDGDYRYNQSACLELQQSVPQTKIADAIEALVAKHAMLRARFHHSETRGWQQRVEKQLAESYHFHTHVSKDDEAAQEILQQSQTSLNIQDGPLFAADLIEIKYPERQILFLTAHHLVIDLMSWRIVLQDLEQLLLGGTAHASHSMPFPAWCGALAEEVRHPSHDEVVSSVPDTASTWNYWGIGPGQYTSSEQVFATSEIDQHTTDLLLGPDVHTAIRSTPVDILLAALMISFQHAFPDRVIPEIFIEGHGRSVPMDHDLSDTVGWFTTITPLGVSHHNDDLDIVSAVKLVKELRRTSADRQVSDFANQYLTTEDRKRSTSYSTREIMFNYHGHFQQLERAESLFRLDKLHAKLQDPQSAIASVGGSVKLQAALNIEVSIESGKMQMRLGFSKNSHRGNEIRQWVQDCSRMVSEVVNVLLHTSPTVTISDFPLARLNSDRDLVTVKEQCLLPAGITSWQDVQDILPCSPIQQGILLSQMKSPSTYWLKETCRVLPTSNSNSVDIDRLANAWRVVVQQHSIMRTIFTSTPLHQDRLYQVVLASPNVTIKVVTCVESEVQQCLEQHSLRDYQPGQPLHQFLIVTTTGGDVYGQFEISHALVDASSVQLLVEALLRAYEAPKATAIQESNYSTYVSYLERRSEEEDLQYWQNLLGSAQPCNLQSDQNLGALSNDADDAMKTHSLSVSEVIQDTMAVYNFCQTHSVTVANVVQLAWALVLASRVDSRDQISFGYLSSGRDVPIDGVDVLIGPMINMMICHFDVESMSGLTSSEAVQAVQNRFLEGFDHQRVSLATLQHSLQQSLFNTTISYRRAQGAGHTKQAGSLQLERIEVDESTEYDFSLNILASDTGIEFDLQYWSSVASPGAAQSLIAQLRHIVTLICMNPAVRIGDLELLSPEDQLAIKTSNSIVPAATENLIHTMTHDVAIRQPDAVAINAWDGTMTYAEVEEAASRLAHYLATSFDIGPEIKVGICMDKSMWTVVAMLATLKVGAVVLPLSTQQPLARLQLVLNDTQAPIILVDSKQLSRLSSLDPHLVLMDEELVKGLPALTTESLGAEVRPDNAAWIVYTSGSTGIPKGVVLQHHALCTSLLAHGTAFGLEASHRVLQFASHTFDVTIQEVFTTFFFGGCVCIPSEEDRLNNLEHAILSLGVNFLSLTSTVAGLLEPQHLPAVRQVILLGEPVNPLVLEKWLKHGATVLGAYGPSECSIQVTTSKQPFAHRKQAPVLGVPLASNFWVVDPTDPDYERLCPIGAPGELLIEGPLLAREYLNDPGKTAKSFVVDPAFLKRYQIGGGTGRRMYRTGDLVRQNYDGTYTILGRRDTQIKIRGQRVEIGEVEYHIGRHSSGVHAAVVLLRGSNPDDTKLVAGFSLPSHAGYNSTTVEEAQDVDKPAAMLVASEVQHYLSQHIPVYMIPHLWVPLKKLPVNQNGKIDRLSLSKYINGLSAEELASYSDFQSVDPQAGDEQELPATPVERQIREIWSKVLNVRNITYRRSFLSYGGDSITAMQVVSACRKSGLTLTVREVLQSHAISELALVARDIKKPALLGEQLLRATEIPDGPFDLSPAQSMYFKDIALDGLQSRGDYRFNQSVVFQLQEPVQQQAKVARAIEVLVSKHAMLRARFQAKTGDKKGWQQRINNNLVGSYHFQTHVLPDDEEARAIIRSSQASLDIEHGPVFAADFIELPDRQLIFLTAHHLVIDLMSWRIITQDLEHLLRDGTTTSASESLSFPSWCAVLLQQAQQRYDHDKGAMTVPDILEIADHVPSWDYWGIKRGQYIWADQAFATATVDKLTTSLLLGSANQALRTSPADILMAALYVSFRKVFTDRSGPSIFIEGHGRGGDASYYDLSETVGWLTTITQLRLSHNQEQDGASAVPLVKQVKDVRKLDMEGQALAFASQYMLQDNVADRVGPIEVLFNFHGQFQQLERQGGLLRFDRLHQPGGQSDISSTGGKVKMQAALNVEISVEDGQAQISIGFSKHSPKQDAIRQWCSEYSEAIVATITELSNTIPTATASDFPLAHLTNPDLALVKQRCLDPVGVAWEDVEDVLPCSPVQQGILLSQLKAPSSYLLKQTCRILPGSNTITGQIDTSRLATAWNHVIQQHSIMRTIFTRALLHQDRFYQIVLKSAEVEVHTIECTTDTDVQECVERLAAHSGTHPGRPQHQFTIIKTTKEGHVYGHFEISHALVDASSVQILIESMLQAYEGVAIIPPSNYGSYVSYLEEASSEEEDLRYWQGLLATAEPCNLQLNQAPFAEVIEVEEETEPVVAVVLQDLSELQNFCRTHSVTPANIFQLAWSIVLGSRMDSPQISFGYLSSGRDVPIDGVDTLVGPMINMMICHLELDYDMTPSKAAQQVQNQFLKGFDHQRAPLAAIQHSLHASQQNLFNTTLSYRRAAADSAGHGQSIQLQQVDAAESTDYDFNLSVNAADSSIELVIQYLPTAANKGAAHRLLCQLKHVIGALCSTVNADTPLGDLELISQEDEKQISNTNSQVPAAVETCIHSLFQEMAASQPSAEAIYAWDGTMTYQALDEAASRLAYHLTGLGIGPEIMVGMCMDKSRWAAVSTLATLKAGGVVLPLATQQPLTRLNMVLEDTKAPIVLVDAAQQERLAGVGPQLIKVDSVLLDTLPAPPTNRPLCPQVDTNNAAWVVYTSGSTGQPKGVVLQHRALCSSIQSHGAAFGVGRRSRVLQFASHTFDVTIQEMFTTLCRGGCVCIPSEDQRLNHLEQATLDMGVNFLSLTSTVAGLLSPARLHAVKTVILMGEPVKPAVVDLWKDQATVLESYAPSECSIYATCSPRSMTNHKQVPVLGVPLSSCFWVVDTKDYNRLCPIGAPGELLIEGPLLARGYLNDPVKTDKSFVTDPSFLARCGLDGKSGRRMYRTGDLVRQNEDGTYTTLGRRDMQVKIWGQRVETGEIEYWVVRSRPEIRTAAAMLAQLGTSRDQGVLAVAVDFTDEVLDEMKADADGFLEPSPSLLDTFEEIRNSLMGVLPRYMVPELFVPMASLPLNSSGKLDRRAIQGAISSLSSQGKLESYLPSTGIKTEVSSATARELRSLWAKVLGRPENTIGANDNFFHTGGDSLMAMRLVQYSRDASFSLTVAQVFAHPRLEDLAGVLEKSSSTDVLDQGQGHGDPPPFSLWSEVHTLEKPDELQSLLADVAERCGLTVAQIEDVYPCTPLQEGLMIATARRSTAYVGRQMFTLDEKVDENRLQVAWQQVTAVAPILRTRIVLGRSSGSLQVVVKDTVNIPWHTSNSLDAYLDKDRAMGMADGQPLMRLGYVEASSSSRRKRYLVWTAHHAIYDGYSMQMLFQQVAAAYQQQTLPPTVPFSRFIGYLGNNANNDEAASFWRAQLSGSEVTAGFPLLPHPNYQPRPTQLQKRQLQLGQHQNPHVAALLRAAWAMVIAQYAGGLDEVLFAVALSGRNAAVAGIMDMLAPTVTTVPLRIHVDSSSGVGEFLDKVKQQAIEMMPFEHTGLQRIKQHVPDLVPALDLHHVFIVQPSLSGAESGSDGLPELVQQPLASEPFHTSALTVECIMTKDPSRVTVEARFDPAVVSPQAMNRILESFAHVAAQLSQAEPHLRISDIQTLAPSDVSRIRVKNTQMPPRPEGCLHDGILAKALEQPFAEAVCAWDGNLTYAELDRWSARLANHLVDIGVAPESNVGLSMAKSKWAVVVMLAILRAGATIVPLGIQLPPTRIEGIMRDAEVRFVVADEQQAVRLTDKGTHIVTLGSTLLDDLASNCSSSFTTRQPKPVAGAFIIYTSGSTGVPKGVVLEHGALSASAQAHGAAFGLDASSRVLQFAAYTFDVSIQENFTTLHYGGCVCVPSEDDRMNNLEGYITATGVNFMSLTSTVAEFLDPINIPTVETLVLLGEPVTPTVVDLWSGHASVLNAYGPAECSIHSTCSSPLIHRKHASQIGRPLPGLCFWVADPRDYNRLCPPGVAGELLIEGHFLARGYLNDPAKTTTSFVIDPEFVQQYDLGRNRRMYRTGDLVQQNDDGTYNMLGRRDTQVKIRGQRVELGEIEYWVLRCLPHVRRAAVTLIPSRGGAGRREGTLAVAIEFDKEGLDGIVPDELSNSLLDVAGSEKLQGLFQQLCSKLREVVPRYMVPDLYIPMATLPLNNSGKLDRKVIRQTLASMTDQVLETYRPKHETRPKAEEALPEVAQELAQMWSTILGKPVDTIELEDNFFTLGADSMSAMQLVSAAKSAGMDLTVTQVFQNPVLRNLCKHVERNASARLTSVNGTNQKDSNREEQVVVLDVTAQDAIKASLPNHKVGTIIETTDFQTLAISEHTLPEGNGGLVMYMTMAFDRKVDKSAVRAAYQHAVDTTEMMRATFVQYHGRTYQAILDGFTGPFQEEYVSGSENLVDFCQLLIQNERLKALPFNEPPLKAWFVQGASRDTLIIRLSHAQYDGLSLPLLLQQLDGAYTNNKSGSSQMSHFINALRSLDKESATDYWRGLLHQSIMPVLPGTRPRPAAGLKRETLMAGNAIRSVVPAFKHRRAGATPAAYVKAAYAMALSKLTATTDIVFGHLVSGRSSPINGIEQVIGPCVNFVPIRVDASSAEWETVLTQVQAQQVSTLPHEHLGFETIFRECTSWSLVNGDHSEHSLNQSRPRFSTILQYQNQSLDASHTIRMYGAECRIAYEATPANITDIWVIVEPQGNGDELHIVAGYFEEVIDSATVQRLVDYLVEAMRVMQEGKIINS
ncbi:NRPS [Trichoderma asperellum]|uniref:NRPS n=1 Tax=Trichoderma asperellum TaxID=101201 RepID=UPI003329A884|nr:NRPS [Trichoderma asperellum]